MKFLKFFEMSRTTRTYVLLIILGICLISIAAVIGGGSNDTNSNTDELVLAQVIYRHGDRNIIMSYPTDPWKNESYWPGGFGELTNIGKRQHYELGSFFRRRYRSLLGDGEYSSHKVYIQSTDKDRAIMSAAANLAGLFPTTNQNAWHENVNWQPIPIHSIPEEYDHLLATSRNCPRFNELLMKFYELPASKAFQRKHQPLFRYLERHTGMPVRSGFEIQPLYNTLVVEALKNKELPKWTKHVFYPGSDFEYIATDMFRTFTRTPEMTRMKFGFLLREIVQHFMNKTESTLHPDRSLWLYSAHDYSITSLLDALGVYDMSWPDYASSLMFELYKTDEDFYIQIFYRNSDAEFIPPIDIPGCGTKCSLKKFYALYEAIIPTGDFNDECLLK